MYISLVAALFFSLSCGNRTGGMIISDTKIKADVLGIKLCEKADKNSIEAALSRVTDNAFITYEEKIGPGSAVRCVPIALTINYGGQAWNYCDTHLNEANEVMEVDLVASFESVERAKDLFDSMVAKLSEKYGKGNIEGSDAFWTDGVNGIGLSYSESSAINGNDRSFCTLGYMNRDLMQTFQEVMDNEL